MSNCSVISELEKIKAVNVSNNMRMINPITKTQREIFEVFGLGEDDVKAFVLSQKQ